MAAAPDSETVERLIPSRPESIFALLVDPARHREIDGSGKVRDPKRSDGQRLRLGSRFGMSMVSGVPYSMVSTVVEFEENRRITWQTTGPTRFGKYFGGRTWRYELRPVDGGTLVRETWDVTTESPTTRWLARKASKSTRTNMAATLVRIEKIVTA